MRLIGIALLLSSVAGLSQPSFVPEVKFNCGDATVSIEVVKRDHAQRELRVEPILSVTRDGVSTILRYWGSIDYIGGVCATDARGNFRIVYQATCGGSGCDSESNWGIIDAFTLRVLLAPRDGNVSEARDILGVELPAIDQKVSVYRSAQRLYPDQQ